MLRLIYTSTKTITVSQPHHLCCIASQDAFCLVMGWTTAHKLFMDGTCIEMGSLITGNIFYLSVAGGHQGHYNVLADKAYRGDEITFQIDPNQVIMTAWGGPIPGSGDFVDPENDLLLRKVGGSIYYYRISTETLLATQEVIPGVVLDSLSWAGRNRVLAFDKDTGKLALVDYLAREVLLLSKITPCHLAAYNPNHEVVVALGTDGKVRVYALEVVPATLSNPEFLPAVPHVHRLMGYTVRVQLTGDEGEACPGYWIQWSLLGEPPKGQLEKEYSRTDESGYAENFWFGPSGAGETGSETVKAQVTV